jgi:hypothetical protein
VRGQRHAPAAFYPRERSIPIVQEAGWAPGPIWTGAEHITPTGIRSPDRPARSQSLYRLSYPGLCIHCHRGKTVIITYSECVLLDLVIQHSVHAPYHVIRSLSGCTILFPHYLINGTILGEGF